MTHAVLLLAGAIVLLVAVVDLTLRQFRVRSGFAYLALGAVGGWAMVAVEGLFFGPLDVATTEEELLPFALAALLGGIVCLMYWAVVRRSPTT